MATLYIFEVQARRPTFVRGQTIQPSDKRVPSLFLNLDLTDEDWQCFHAGPVLLYSLVPTVDAPPIKWVSEGCWYSSIYFNDISIPGNYHVYLLLRTQDWSPSVSESIMITWVNRLTVYRSDFDSFAPTGELRRMLYISVDECLKFPYSTPIWLIQFSVH
jgi:hypothetical protein